MYMCIHAACAHVCLRTCVQMDVCTWRPEIDVRYLSLPTLFFLFTTGSLTEPETCHFPGWPARAPILSLLPRQQQDSVLTNASEFSHGCLNSDSRLSCVHTQQGFYWMILLLGPSCLIDEGAKILKRQGLLRPCTFVWLLSYQSFPS